MATVIKLPIGWLHPHKDNPRQDVGDVTELAESIKANGILQNLTVVPNNDDWTDFTIVIGHRRFAAAKLAGLDELPCSVVEMPYKEQIQTMMVENMQRSDLTLFEQANGFQMMLDLGSPVDEIAERTGFSDTTVRKRLKWMELDHEKLKEKCAQQISVTDLDRLSQINSLDVRNDCLDKIGTRDFDMAVQKAIKEQGIEDNMPKVKAWLKEVKAKKIPDSKRWGSEYDRVGSTIYIDKWGENGNTPKPGIECEPVFYWMGEKKTYSYGQLELFHERKKAPPVRKSPEEKAKEAAIKEAWDSLNATASAAYNLRKQFVENLSVTKKNEADVFRGAIYSSTNATLSFVSPDRELVKKIIGADTAYCDKNIAIFQSKIDTLSGNEWAQLCYASFGDSDSKTCTNGYQKMFPEFKPNSTLQLLYRWLNSLGYEMSTEEIQLLGGDHPAFKAKEEFENG